MPVHNTLVGLGMRDRLRIGAAGKIVSAFDIARTLATGADWCNAGRGFMFALGCIQSLSCHTNRCPTGIATQDPARWKHLDVTDKAVRVAAFHDNTVRALRDLLCAAGLEHPDQLGPEHILRRVSPFEVRSLSALYRYLEPGELLGGRLPEHAVFREFWQQARSDAFMPPAHVARLRGSKASRDADRLRWRSPATSNPALSHLDRLEAESIHILREVAAGFRNPVLLSSVGKDSSVLLHLLLTAFHPGRPPIPLLHV